MTRMTRIVIVFLLSSLMIMPAGAQEQLDWCEVTEPPAPEPFPHGETPPVPDALAEQLEIPADYTLTTTSVQPDVILSPDEKHLITGIGNWQTADFTLIAFNSETGQIYAQIDQETLEKLRPTTTIDTDVPRDGIYFRNVQWIADSSRIAFQTGDYYVNSGEWAPPFDDLHIIEPDGTIRTMFAPGEGGNVAFSPDGEWVASANLDGLTLVRVDGSDRRADVLGDDYFAEFISGNAIIPRMRWQDDGEFLRVFVAPDIVDDMDDFWDMSYTFEWHVYPDERPPELHRQFDASFMTLSLAPRNSHLVAYVEITGTYDDGYAYTGVVEDLDTKLQYRMPTEDSLYRIGWVFRAEKPTLRVVYDDRVMFLAACDEVQR